MDFSTGVPSDASIDRVIAESQAENEKPRIAVQASTPPPVRGRGRPRKGAAPNKATIEKMKSALGAEPTPGAAPSDGVGSHTDSVAFQPMEIPTEALTSVLKMPFNLLRARTKFPGFKLDDETAKECAPLLNQVINQYLPNVDPKHAPAIMLTATLCTILLSEATAYSEWVAAQTPPAPAPKYSDPIAPQYARTM